MMKLHKPGLEFTTRVGCRVACSYCPQSTVTTAYRARPIHPDDVLLKPETFAAMLAKVPATVVITFAGYSEPWLNPNATQMLEYAHTQGHPLEVFTTLDGMTLLDIERVARLPYDQFTIHLPSDDKRMHLKVDAAYLEKAQAVLRALPQARWVHYGERLHPALPAEIAALAEQDPIHNRAGNTLALDWKSPRRLVGTIRCAHLPVRHMVLPNGDVSLCCMDWSLQHRLGNLLEQSYQSIVESPEMQRVMAGWKDDRQEILCRQCPQGFHSNVDVKARLLNHRLPQLKRFLKRLLPRPLSEPSP